MKNTFHLERMASTLHRRIYPAAVARGDAFHLLVIDDEADDSSVLDAVEEARTGISLADTKQVPRRIADLWESRSSRGETTAANLFVTYIAYTATPQANFLQDANNSLFPRDFAVSLRTPGPSGTLSPRMPSYSDPAGLPKWYTGGDIFYDTLNSIPLCRTTDGATEVFGNALRSYFVASAIRLWRLPGAIGPTSAKTAVFKSRQEAKDKLAPVSAMLIHPSSAKDDHFETAAQVLSWCNELTLIDARRQIDLGNRQISSEGIAARIDAELPEWTYWLNEFESAAHDTYVKLSLPERPSTPRIEDWPEIRRLILEEIAPATTVAVINSDESADDRPSFSVRSSESEWLPPINGSTVFVSGNVMARGLTLEGLTTTLFGRRSDSPLADTQMQMQRWFGYRGDTIDLCRIFLSSAQLELFASYHEADVAIRHDIFAAMAQPDGFEVAVTVLQGYRFAATGKIANVSARSIWPGPSPFVRHMNEPHLDLANADWVASYFQRPTSVVSSSDGRDLGLLLDDDLNLLQAANFLDGFSYPDFGPSLSSEEFTRWASLSNHLQLSPQDPEFPLFRAPVVDNGVDLRSGSPYDLAAYLRAWSAALSRRAAGLVTTDPPFGPWGLVDLKARLSMSPVFRVGLRFGRGPVITTGALSTLGYDVRSMERAVTADGDLRDGWGARGAAGSVSTLGEGVGAYPGDNNFDYFGRAQIIPAGIPGYSGRKPGEPGLILIHPVLRGASEVSLAVGVSLPLGGPDQVAAYAAGN